MFFQTFLDIDYSKLKLPRKCLKKEAGSDEELPRAADRLPEAFASSASARRPAPGGGARRPPHRCRGVLRVRSPDAPCPAESGA